MKRKSDTHDIDPTDIDELDAILKKKRNQKRGGP